MKGPNQYGAYLTIDLPQHQKNIARYIWHIFAEATNFRVSDFPSTPFVIDSSGSFSITPSFQDFLDGNINRVAMKYNLPEGLHHFRKSEPLACAFYLINNLHETLLPDHKLDKYGRYPYQESIQHANDLIQTNFVQEIFDDIFMSLTGKTADKMDSQLMWTHDIDYLYSAWKSDLILAYRESNYSKIPRHLWRALTTPRRWNNIIEILELEKEYDIQSIFFWLTESGKSQVTPSHSIDHADYHFGMKQLKYYWQKVSEAGSKHGLHKSTFPGQMDKEMQKMPEQVLINRNHFLKFQIPHHYEQVEKAGLRYDASLGFAEHYGFRNSFGRPFQPYHLRLNRPYHFIEYPLHLMDTTFTTYLNHNHESMTQKMSEFINQHRQNCCLGILLHNNQFNFHDQEQIKIWKQFFDSLHNMESTLPPEL